MTGPTFNQSHSGSGHNIVNYGKQRFEMTEALMAETLSQLDPATPVTIYAIGPSKNDAMTLANI